MVKWSVFVGIFLRDLKRKSKFQLSKNPPRRYTKTAPLHPFCPHFTPAGTCWNPIRTQLNEGWREGLTIYSHFDRKTWKSQNSSRHFPPKKTLFLIGIRGLPSCYVELLRVPSVFHIKFHEAPINFHGVESHSSGRGKVGLV